ncbi:MAG: imidazole glycerol phosphate synthase subunit HisF [Candidatus Magasanikbacteria bacterium]
MTKRIIPCLDVKDGKVVKGIHFTKLTDAGDAVKLAQLYSQSGADELVFLDITATSEKRKTLRELVEKIAKNINIPFTVGGGIADINDVKCLLNAGADKVSLCTAAVLNPALVKSISQKYGSQCLVISIDAKKTGKIWMIYIRGGKQKTDINAITFAKKMEKLGAGELLVNSLDRDGTKKGFDIELLNKISRSVRIPVIASSGAGTKKDFLDVLKQTNVDAVLAATVFHYEKIKIKKLKRYLKNNNLPIRL